MSGVGRGPQDRLRERLRGEGLALDAQIATCEHALHKSPLGCLYCKRDTRLRALLADALAALDARQVGGTPFTCDMSNIAAILLDRFGVGDPGSGLSLNCHEGHTLIAALSDWARRIEEARNHLDIAHSQNDRAEILKADAILRRIKLDMGFPSAGLPAAALDASRAHTCECAICLVMNGTGEPK